MKVLRKFVCALLVPLLCACVQEIPETVAEPVYYLDASTESGPLSKTSLEASSAGVSRVLWTEGDRIAVFADGAADPALFNITSGVGETEAVFSGPIKGETLRAVYPWSIAESDDGNAFSVILPEEQEYVPDSFAPGAFPMVAAAGGSSLRFRNVCSVLKVSITGTNAVKALEFIPKDPSVKVSGPAQISMSSPSDTPGIAVSSEGKGHVVLKVPGVILNEETPTHFYLVLPPRTYKGGFTVRIQTPGGSMDKVYGQDFTMERSRLHASTPFRLKLDNGVEPSDRLTGKGTEDSPLLIGSVADLLHMQMAVNIIDGMVETDGGESVPAATACYKLTADLDLSPVCGPDNGRSWTPIGDRSTDDRIVFGGVFDGDGHSISHLFIDNELNHQGLFGYADYTSKIRGLRIRGNVSAASYSGLLAGYATDVSDCIAEDGEVVGGGSYVGGLVGYAVSMCDVTNRATVRTLNGTCDYVGGIAGYVMGYSDCRNCVNEGTVSSDGARVAGVFGYAGGPVFNCVNSGAVTGGGSCGGVVGFVDTFWHGSVSNCINYGKVTSLGGNAGGIAGTLAENCYIMNCINLADVVDISHFKTDAASVCGSNLGAIDHCYWPEDAVAMSFFRGTFTDCHPFTPAYLQGGDTGNVLYTTVGGYPCTTLLDALNGWAYDNSTAERKYNGWERDMQGDLYLRLTSEPAADPGSGAGVFRFVPPLIETGAEGGEFSIRVYSSVGYHIESVPSWTHAGEAAAVPGAANNRTHSFSADANPDDAGREGVIVFCNDAGNCVPATVKQCGKTEFNWGQAFKHRSLYMVFSYYGVGYYDSDAIMGPFRDRLVYAVVSGDEKLFPQSMQFCDAYGGINGWPVLWVDFRSKLHNGSNDYVKEGLSIALDAMEGRETRSFADIRSTVSGRSVSVSVDGYFKKAGNYRINVMLMEDSVKDSDDRTVNHLIRTVLTDLAGSPFTVEADRTCKEFSYNCEIPQGYDLSRMHVLVYFSHTLNGEKYFVDNAFSVPLGEQAH